MSDFHERKAQRKAHYEQFEYGWILVDCPACSGSGVYDNEGSPPCGGCDGTGKDRVRGPKSLELNKKST